MESSRELIETLSSSTNYRDTKIPVAFSRRKALKLLSERKELAVVVHTGIPSKEAIRSIQMLHTKIGASNDLPQKAELRYSYLCELWNTMYLKNNLCPGDVPFPIVLTEFTEALVHGRAERKGNNMSAIVQCFNAWIVKEEVRFKLIQERDRIFPASKPKQVGGRTSSNLSELSVEELEHRIKKLQPFEKLKTTQEMKKSYEEELAKRGK